MSFDLFSSPYFTSLFPSEYRQTMLSETRNKIANWAPQWCNHYSTETEYVYEISVPGLTKEEVSVDVTDDGYLVVKGDKSTKHEERKDNYVRREFGHKVFNHREQLPLDTNLDTVRAKVEEGVLTVTFEKVKDVDKKLTINVKVE